MKGRGNRQEIDPVSELAKDRRLCWQILVLKLIGTTADTVFTRWPPATRLPPNRTQWCKISPNPSRPPHTGSRGRNHIRGERRLGRAFRVNVYFYYLFFHYAQSTRHDDVVLLYYCVQLCKLITEYTYSTQWSLFTAAHLYNEVHCMLWYVVLICDKFA